MKSSQNEFDCYISQMLKFYHEKKSSHQPFMEISLPKKKALISFKDFELLDIFYRIIFFIISSMASKLINIR